jgi:DDE_Tnp_1-associated/Transposase DDE domain
MLKALLEQVPDPRGRQGRDYALWSILGLIMVGLLCGRHGLASVFRLGRGLSKEQQRHLGFTRGMPCHSTLTTTMGMIDADALAQVLGGAMFHEGRHMSIDGKTMRATKDKEGRATHCVSAFCEGLLQVAGHTASTGKGMEIPDALALLDRLCLANKVVTTDALLCQKSVAAKVIGKGGDYVLPVKDNQKTLREDIQTAFETPVFPPGQLGGTRKQGTRANRKAQHRRTARKRSGSNG